MKKALLLVITVLLLIVLTWKLDKVTRVKPKASTNDTVQADATLGTLAPNVTFKDLDGNNVHLSKYRGKVVIVNFWGTCCERCRGEIPCVIEMLRIYIANGFTVLGVEADD